MEHLYIPPDYSSALGLYDTQVAIKTVKDFFQQSLAEQLYLLRVSAPLFVTPESGLNDNLNGVERPVTFGIREQNERPAEIVHSLAKWKRNALKQYGFHIGEGLYTDMSAIRRDEDTDNIHSIYVDQWDWEKIILKEDRNVEYLKETVRKVYKALKKTEKYMAIRYDYIEEILPKEIFFITTQELADLYPDKTPKEREDAITKEKGAVFLMEIGDKLANGEPHDGRAPDYDDWHLNGDILVWYPVLGHSLELSSMGIRVDENSLARQLKLSGCEDRAKLPFQKNILEKKLPYTVGGGIGQSRICMFYLRKAHIGEVQVSIWPDEVREKCARYGINLL
ncbi:aspartate--ammonia ligase [Anaerosacchariphilus sp. NSJ-68]|uniref:Aspartate--ammonia ligase n=2 Tax=Lachnospiraceae TaxID=186803 RepID=A0A923LAP4_9FIRM|nr:MULTISPECIES: aspartate--ammonia ligase [Lachnospiraceae]MBC5658813.1 aspartate--ammonia ligase [Anaerosacchariphilus hominis]MBC5698918.1 aspartate--ammonia ligase [Roseburia difficilis]